MRLQAKREKQRIRKQTKPIYDAYTQERVLARSRESGWSKIVKWLSRPVPKEENRDRRKRDNNKQGNR